MPFEDRKDPTAYLFRRNFGTHLHILGLSEPEIEYVIGHDIDDPYETRNEFVNEEKLFAIKQKMDRRPLVNSDLSELERIDAGERLQLQHTACVQIPAESAETEIHLGAVHLGTAVQILAADRGGGHQTQLIAHAVEGYHMAGDGGGLLDVVGGAVGLYAEDHLLSGPAAQHAADGKSGERTGRKPHF